jgi:hypothetical protein
MNVLEMIRTKTQKLNALKQAQVAAAKGSRTALVYRGLAYQKAS